MPPKVPVLKPCPFCEGQGEHQYEETTRFSGVDTVRCRECGVKMIGKSEVDCAEKWNRRDWGK